MLRKKAKKDRKNMAKKLAQEERCATFAPATAKNAHRNTGK